MYLKADEPITCSIEIQKIDTSMGVKLVLNWYEDIISRLIGRHRCNQ